MTARSQTGWANTASMTPNRMESTLVSEAKDVRYWELSNNTTKATLYVSTMAQTTPRPIHCAFAGTASLSATM